MPALMPTEHSGRIAWLGRVPHRDRLEIDGEPVGEMPLSFDGLEGEVHAGRTRPSCARVLAQHPRGTEIANTRQIAIVSVEELDTIARGLDVERLDPAWLGASIAIEGLPDFSYIPPSSRLQAPDGTTLVVDMQNEPCTLVAKTLVEQIGDAGKRFKSAAAGLRGVTAWVERPGTLRIGDPLRLHIPNQRAWKGE
ncbi:MOSC domain-containing protein [Palleronia caenipelagi]|uniref:MOSC domain-containing protein n=1 Tax=Palleronia caenipelagi TaxID=2489174 RepID=A0A547Q7X4_9RHOB|nr:MOSC domain-containing protein [Palleronia caenipelagi]TRD22478.1 MOSC domain-containing protein [Palleronia caenipelagi]